MACFNSCKNLTSSIHEGRMNLLFNSKVKRRFPSFNFMVKMRLNTRSIRNWWYWKWPQGAVVVVAKIFLCYTPCIHFKMPISLKCRPLKQYISVVATFNLLQTKNCAVSFKSGTKKDPIYLVICRL